MNQSCEVARGAIQARRFEGWRGLAPGCTPEALFDVRLDDAWGEMRLGATFEPARSRLLDLDGYYRPLAFVRDGMVVMFDGTNPELDTDWGTLSDGLGRPDAQFDWVLGTEKMPRGELVYAGRGITVFLNPENDFVVHVSLYVPTTLQGYVQRLRQSREKRAFR